MIWTMMLAALGLHLYGGSVRELYWPLVTTVGWLCVCTAAFGIYRMGVALYFGLRAKQALRREQVAHIVGYGACMVMGAAIYYAMMLKQKELLTLILETLEAAT